MRPISYLPGARDDFDESFDWYAEQSTVAAARFADAIAVALARIADDSGTLPFVDHLHTGMLGPTLPLSCHLPPTRK